MKTRWEGLILVLLCSLTGCISPKDSGVDAALTREGSIAKTQERHTHSPVLTNESRANCIYQHDNYKFSSGSLDKYLPDSSKDSSGFLLECNGYILRKEDERDDTFFKKVFCENPIVDLRAKVVRIIEGGSYETFPGNDKRESVVLQIKHPAKYKKKQLIVTFKNEINDNILKDIGTEIVFKFPVALLGNEVEYPCNDNGNKTCVSLVDIYMADLKDFSVCK